jgi:hypothetical protein
MTNETLILEAIKAELTSLEEVFGQLSVELNWEASEPKAFHSFANTSNYYRIVTERALTFGKAA